MLKGLLAIGLAVLLCWPASCAAQTADPGAIRVGDRWSYDIKDELTGDLRQTSTIVVVDINDKEITTRTTYRGKDRPQTMVFDLDWGRIDDGVWKLSPSGIGDEEAAAGRQRVAIRRQRGEFAIRRSFSCVRGGKGDEPGAAHDAGRNVRHVSGGNDSQTDQHEGSNQVFDVDLCGLARACSQSMGEEEDGSAL